MNNPITVETTINSTIENVWKLWTTPADIMQWNNPSDDWQTPKVENDLKDGGQFLFQMETKDGSERFDFGGQYDKVIVNKMIEYTLDDGRKTVNKFIEIENKVTITETFEPEIKTPRDLQKNFCQEVLNNFKKYAEKKNNKAESLIKEIMIELEKTSDELIKLIESTNNDQFNEIPFEESWSVAQIANHLFKSYGLVDILNSGRVRPTKRLPGKEIEQVKKIFLDFEAKYKSAELLLPADKPIEKQQILTLLQKRIGEIMEVIQTKDLTETCVGIPFKGIGELTRLEWLYVILYHTQRHIHQMKNILKSMETISNKAFN